VRVRVCRQRCVWIKRFFFAAFFLPKNLARAVFEASGVPRPRACPRLRATPHINQAVFLCGFLFS
jgi:hypothetical protein